MDTGACCYTVVGSKTLVTPTSNNLNVLKELAAAYPIGIKKDDMPETKYFCSTDAALATQTGWTATAAMDGMTVGGSGDLSGRWVKGTSKRTALKAMTATWTCSGAQSLAATGVAAFTLISLM